jgi:hypothetical protein
VYPDLWGYKRGNSFLCSWKCLRRYDKYTQERKEAGQVKKVTANKRGRMSRDDMDEAVRMWREGDSGLDQYLTDHGITNVSKWKANAKDRYGREEKLKELKEDFAEKGVELVYDPEIAEEYRREQEQKKANEQARAEELMKSLPPVNVWTEAPDESEVWHTAAIRNDRLGEFYYDRKYRTIDWRHPAGEEISLPPEDFAALADMIPRILHVLGVEWQR